MKVRSVISATLVALACLFGSLPPAPAQQEVVFGDRVEVELVLVDVFVEGKDGTPITDLGVEDFSLFQDGKPVTISQFTPARGLGAAPSPAATRASSAAFPTTVAAPRRLILFLDNLHLHPNSRGRLMRQLSDRLEDQLEPTDEVMVVAYGGTTEVLLPMGRDRRALKRVLREQAESGAVSLLSSYDDQRILDVIQNRHNEETLNSGFVGGDPCVDLGSIAHSHAQQVYGRVMGTISELDRFVGSLAGYEGRKVLLHVSDGIPLIPGAEAYRFASELCDGTGANKGLERAVDTALFGVGRTTRWDPTKTAATLQEFNTADEWTRLAGQANTYQVSFFMFQAHMANNRASNVDGARTSFDTEMDAKRNRQDPLFLLADETGGMALLDSNEIGRALDQMTEDWRAGYQLAFEPPTPGDGRRHNIRLEVDRPGVRLRHRKSYLSKRADERIADRVISTLLHGQTSNPLGVRLQPAEQVEMGHNVTNVRVRITVPLERLILLGEEGMSRGLFTVFIAARDAYGGLTPVGQKTVPLRIPPDGARQDYVYAVDIPIRGDQGLVAVAVQDQLSGEVSYVREQVRGLPSS